jgi:hypothetical protein
MESEMPGQTLLPALRCFPVSVIGPLSSAVSFVFHRRYVTLGTESIIKHHAVKQTDNRFNQNSFRNFEFET